jgi:hypothetical protein
MALDDASAEVRPRGRAPATRPRAAPTGHALIGLKEEAQALAESLAEFARDQSIVVAPSSQQDVRKIAAMAAVGAQGAAPLTGAQVAALASVIRRPDGEGS